MNVSDIKIYNNDDITNKKPQNEINPPQREFTTQYIRNIYGIGYREFHGRHSKHKVEGKSE